MSRGITLKGEAARAFVEGAMDKKLGDKNGKPKKPLSKSDKYLFIATKVAMYMKSGLKTDASVAVDILAVLDDKDLETAYEMARVV